MFILKDDGVETTIYSKLGGEEKKNIEMKKSVFRHCLSKFRYKL